MTRQPARKWRFARRSRSTMTPIRLGIVLAVSVVAVSPARGAGATPDIDRARALVEQREEERIALIDRLSPTVVCVFDETQGNAGTGVLIDRQGYGLTNYHVVRKMLKTRHGLGGLSDGKLYDLEVLGIDPTGDVAMFRLTGKEGGFEFAELGDSSTVAVGDTAIAMGNPFSLSEDYTPTVTLGMVTGVHRYQKGTGKNLIYSDCIQVDAPINPGNSGGPLFNDRGEVIGINGRISVSMRGRLNVGFGYAIASNQVKRFMPSLRAGLMTRHGTLQATVEDSLAGEVVFSQVRRGASADTAGVRVGDRLVRLDGLAITSRNHFASLLGTYPADWPVLLNVVRQGDPLEFVAKLDAIPPKLAKPFDVDVEVNTQEVERMLRRFQAAVAGGPRESVRAPASWRIDRQYAVAADGTTRPGERFDVSAVGDGPVHIVRLYEDGSRGGLVEYDDRSAKLVHINVDGDRVHEPDGATREEARANSAGGFDLPLEQQLIHNALYVFHRRLFTPVEALDLANVKHVGGDRRLMTTGDSAGGQSRIDATGEGKAGEARDIPVVWRLLEVVEWPIGQHGVARLGFDAKTGVLDRIDVIDEPSGMRVSIDLLDYRQAGDVLWPRALEVRGPTMDYRDELSFPETTP